MIFNTRKKLRDMREKSLCNLNKMEELQYRIDRVKLETRLVNEIIFVGFFMLTGCTAIALLVVNGASL